MEPFSLPLPPPLPTPPPRHDLPPPSPPLSPDSPTRARPPPSEHIQVVRELWVLRERGAVRALEPDFLMRLAFLLGGGVRVREARRDSHWVRGGGRDENSVDDSQVGISSERARELPVGSARRDVDAARAQRRVSRLSPSFRARLEGLQTDNDTNRRPVRTASWSDLNEQRAVTNTLESGFRHELEGMLVRRGNRDNTRYYARHVVHRPPRELVGVEEPQEEMNDATGRDMRTALRSLQEEVAALKQVMDASFDVQLDIQRAVRQEVAAALNSNSSTKRVMAPVSGAGPSSDTKLSDERREVRPLGGGPCAICMERSIDSLLYACGHLWYVRVLSNYVKLLEHILTELVCNFESL